MLEYAAPGPGNFADMAETRKERGPCGVNPRTDVVETPEAILDRLQEALECLQSERIYLNPNCDFDTFDSRLMNTHEIAGVKLISIGDAARQLRMS